MKFLTFATSALSAFSLASSQLVTPSFVEPQADLVERDFSVSSLVAELLDGFDVADYISDINYEKIAGWADNLLNEDNHIEILDKILVELKDTKILPEAAVYVVTHNSTWHVLKEALPTVLKVAGKVNTTALFEALDRSGLAYSVIAGSLTDDTLISSVLSIAKKLISTGDISLQSLLSQAEDLVERDTIYEEFEPEYGSFELLEKRDNVEDLLTTVFGSIERSGLVNSTLDTLLSNDEFQDATVVLIQGALQNIGSLIKGANFTALSPILKSLKSSGLLTHTIERALNDTSLREALTTDLASLLKKGTISKSDLVSKDKEQEILAMDRSLSENASATEAASQSGYASEVHDFIASTTSSGDSLSSDSSASSASSTSSSSSDSDSSAMPSRVGIFQILACLVAPIAIILM